MNYREESLKLHGQWKGKIEVVAHASVAKAVAEAAIATGVNKI